MGGLDGFGPVAPDDDEPLFHAEWERRVLALTLAMGATGEWNLDQSRSARESLPPVTYLSAGYYRIWLQALENLLEARGLATRTELDDGQLREPGRMLTRVLQDDAVATVLKRGAPVDRPAAAPALFRVGQAVHVLNHQLPGHTRLPSYIRNQVGIVHRVHGCHVYPDANATGQGEDPRWLYNVRFDAAALWGERATGPGVVHVDCWEPYLAVSSDADALTGHT